MSVLSLPSVEDKDHQHTVAIDPVEHPIQILRLDDEMHAAFIGRPTKPWQLFEPRNGRPNALGHTARATWLRSPIL